MSGDPEEVPAITPAELQERIDAGDPVRVLDLRNRDEIEQWRPAGPSVSVTGTAYSAVVAARVRDDPEVVASDVDGEGPITTVCGRASASAEVAADLAAAGSDARNLAGGTEVRARLSRSVEVDVGPATLVQYRRPASGCLSYAVVADGAVAVVDPHRAFVDRYVADADARDAGSRRSVHRAAGRVSGVGRLRDDRRRVRRLRHRGPAAAAGERRNDRRDRSRSGDRGR